MDKGDCLSDSVLASENPWYLLQIKPNGLARAEVNLTRQGVAVFSPRHRSPKPDGGMKLQALFPGYVFASFKASEVPFRAINSTFGVSRLVMQGYDLQAGLPYDLMSRLISRCDEEGVLFPPDQLQANESVRILSGPFARYVAVVEKMTTSERVRVLFELMGRTVSAEVDVSSLERELAS